MKKLLLLLVFAVTAVFGVKADEALWFESKIPKTLVKSSGKKVSTVDALKNKYVAFYFSASWCGPCRQFTPVLAKFYRKAKKAGNLEIVFVSLDKNEKSMKAYMKKMPWLAVPFGADCRKFANEMKVRGIPSLIVFDPNGKMVTSNGRGDVVKFGAKAVERWNPGSKNPSASNE